MNIIGIIPARMASTRFPGKPLANICGIPMVGHVYFRSRISKSLSDVYIATCDDEIASYALSIGCRPIMTADTHERASDRASEAMLRIEKESGKRIDLVVMIQGDEPMLYPGMIDEAVKPMLEDDSIEIVNLMAAVKSPDEQVDPNTVKVVTGMNGNALYFSREAIPSIKKSKIRPHVAYKQVPIIPFRREFLIKFNNLTPTPLEIIESVDMLRILEHGYGVRMVLTNYETHSVDTVEDLEKVEALLSKDSLLCKYKESALH